MLRTKVYKFGTQQYKDFIPIWDVVNMFNVSGIFQYGIAKVYYGEKNNSIAIEFENNNNMEKFRKVFKEI